MAFAVARGRRTVSMLSSGLTVAASLYGMLACVARCAGCCVMRAHCVQDKAAPAPVYVLRLHDDEPCSGGVDALAWVVAARTRGEVSARGVHARDHGVHVVALYDTAPAVDVVCLRWSGSSWRDGHLAVLRQHKAMGKVRAYACECLDG